MSYDFTLTDGTPLTIVEPLEGNGYGAQSVPRAILDINFDTPNEFVVADDVTSRFTAGFSFNVITGPYDSTYIVDAGGSTYDLGTNTTIIPVTASVAAAPLLIVGVTTGAGGIWAIEGAINGDCVYYPGATFTVVGSGPGDGVYTVASADVSGSYAIAAVNPGTSTWSFTGGDHTDFFTPGRTFKISAANPGGGTYTVVSSSFTVTTDVVVLEVIPGGATTFGFGTITPAITLVTVTGVIPGGATATGTATVPVSVAYTFSSAPTMLTNIGPNTYTIIWHLTGNHASKFVTGCAVVIKNNDVFDDISMTVLTAVDNGANTDVTVQFNYPTAPTMPNATGSLTFPLPPIPYGFIQYESVPAATSLQLVGRGSPAFNNEITWGEALQNNDIHITEHFNNTSPPVAPLQGQLWFNQTTNTLFLFTSTIYNIENVTPGSDEWVIDGSVDKDGNSLGGIDLTTVFTPGVQFAVYNNPGIDAAGSYAPTLLFEVLTSTNAGTGTDTTITISTTPSFTPPFVFIEATIPAEADDFVVPGIAPYGHLYTMTEWHQVAMLDDIFRLDPKAPVRVATTPTTPFTLGVDYTQAGSGPTHILTAVPNGVLSIDGVSTGWFDMDNDGGTRFPGNNIPPVPIYAANNAVSPDEFVLSGNYVPFFPVGRTFSVSGSASNDGAYTVTTPTTFSGGLTTIHVANGTIPVTEAPGFGTGSIVSPPASRVLVKDASDPSDNGIYAVKNKGSGGTQWELIRSADADDTPAIGEVSPGMFTFVETGTENVNSGWTLVTDNPIILEVTGLVFFRFTAISEPNTQIVFGTGPGTPITSSADFTFDDTTDTVLIGAGGNVGTITNSGGGMIEFNTNALGNIVLTAANLDSIEIGASINLTGADAATGSPITISAGNSSANVGAALSLTAGSSTNPTNAGGNVIITSGDGATTGAGGVVSLVAGVSPAGTDGSIRFTTNAVERLEILGDGSWEVGGTVGTAEQVIASQGAGLPPTWQSVSNLINEPANQIVFGTGTSITSDADFTYTNTTGAFYVNSTNGTTGSVSVAAPGTVGVFAASNTTAAGAGGTLSLTAGNGNTTGAGGNIGVLAGTGGATGVGGNITLTAGPGGSTSGAGGLVQISGGAPTDGNGGAVSFIGANGVGTNRTGGNVVLTAGSSTGTAAGALVQITSGNGGSTGANGGAINITAGNATTSNIGGVVTIRSGIGGTTGTGGTTTLAGGAGGTTSGAGGVAAIEGGLPVDGNGGAVTITARAGVGTNRNGGNLTLTAGDRTGSGTAGVINLVIPATGTLQINSNAGIAGQALVSNGSAAAPTWQAVAAASAASLITSLTNGNAGAITIGRPVYVSAASTVDLADASATATATPTIGLVFDASIASAGSGNIITHGRISNANWTTATGAATLTTGSTYYLSETTGQITTTAPVTVGSWVIPIGIALSTTDLLVNIGTPIQN